MNYISRDPATFNQSMGSDSFIQMTFNMIQKVLYLARQTADKDNGITSFKILMAYLENLYGKLDHILPFIVDTCVTELNSLHPK